MTDADDRFAQLFLLGAFIVLLFFGAFQCGDAHGQCHQACAGHNRYLIRGSDCECLDTREHRSWE